MRAKTAGMLLAMLAGTAWGQAGGLSLSHGNSMPGSR